MNNISYEEAFKELEEITQKIEKGDVKVNDMVTLLERGKDLVEVCYNKLNETKGKLTEIKEYADKIEEE